MATPYRVVIVVVYDSRLFLLHLKDIDVQQTTYINTDDDYKNVQRKIGLNLVPT